MHNNQFELTVFEKNKIIDKIKNYENPRAVSIEALKIVQKTRKWISDEAILAISEILGIPSVDVEGVATFYNQIFRKPVGINIIRYCDSIVCYINGCKKIKKILEQTLQIKPGQTTTDRCFTLLPTCCLGNCDKGPVIMINEKIYFYLNPQLMINVLDSYI